MFATLASLLALTQDAPKAETALISDTSVIQAGHPFTVALQIKMPTSWHTYYLNPGEAGQATEITWKLPAGFTAGKIQWPVPERTDFEGIASYVYDNEVWLLTTITPPKTFIGTTVNIGAKAKWLLCSTGCVPQSAELSLKLGAGTAAAPNAAEKDHFTKAWQSIPEPSGMISPIAVAQNKQVLLRITGPKDPKGVQFISADADAFGASTAKVSTRADGLDIIVPTSAYAKTLPPRLVGILVLPMPDGKAKAYAIDVPMAKH